MDEYNWPDLYRQADEFMRQYIPETMIHTRVRLLFDGRPAVTVHFPAKWHKQELDLFYGRWIENIWRRESYQLTKKEIVLLYG